MIEIEAVLKCARAVVKGDDLRRELSGFASSREAVFARALLELHAQGKGETITATIETIGLDDGPGAVLRLTADDTRKLARFLYSEIVLTLPKEDGDE